ncbi:MAG: DUF11 domain-containing protein [Chloracidobacterium sp.]|nr:DUF11 domain-containing protein [Chloracidobacterium sp.]
MPDCRGSLKFATFLVALSVFFVIGKNELFADVLAIRAEERSSVAAKPPVLFSANSLIIPMDTGANGQNNGMLRAYGLVYTLLKSNVPVHWVIDPLKVTNGNDFVISSGSLQDVRTGAIVTVPRSYAGGPFVIDASDAAAALPIISSWQAVAGDNTEVHRLTSGSFMPEVARLLIRAPRIAILKDGNEQIAFSDLNAAGIPDATGTIWSSTSPDILTEADIQGPSTSNDADGVLFHTPGGLARFGFMASMHYITTANTAEVVQETRSWLSGNVLAHAFMQCEAARVFENDINGFFLSTSGIADDGSAPTTSAIRSPSDPLAQISGSFEADSGSVDSIGLAGGSTFHSGVTTLINNSASTLIQRIVMLSGKVDGDINKGTVTYLGGHDYTLDLPISTNPQTNGVRLFLNSIFESGIATDAGQADVAITKSAPAFTNTNTIAYTINYSNPGPRPVENLRIIDTLPAGATYLAGSGAPAPTTNSGGILTWNLPPLASGAGGSVSFSVTVTSDGPYTNRSQVQFSHLAVRTVSSNAVITTRDTIAPLVSIPGEPANPSVTNDATPTLFFSVTGGAAAILCRFNSDSFVPCTSPFTAAVPLADGPHILEVRGIDAAGNIGSDSYAFTVDSTPSVISGTVTYGNAAVPPKYISNVTITGVGSPIVATTTAGPGATAGQYSLSGFGAGSYTITPTKTGGQNNAINSFDAARVAQHVSGISLLTGNAFLSADVSNNGGVSSFDAAEIANFTVSSSPVGIAGTWKFIPVSKFYASITTDITAEDYVGLLMGEVSGNWNNTGARPAYSRKTAGAEGSGREAEDSKQLEVEVGNYTTAEKEIVVPVNIQGIANKGVISYEFELRYAPSVIQPLVDPVDVTRTTSRGLSVVTNATEPGLLRVAVYGAYPIDADGVLLNLRFSSVGAPGSVSPLSFERIMFNEGESRVVVADGRIELF